MFLLFVKAKIKLLSQWIEKATTPPTTLQDEDFLSSKGTSLLKWTKLQLRLLTQDLLYTYNKHACAFVCETDRENGTRNYQEWTCEENVGRGLINKSFFGWIWYNITNINVFYISFSRWKDCVVGLDKEPTAIWSHMVEHTQFGSGPFSIYVGPLLLSAIL